MKLRIAVTRRGLLAAGAALGRRVRFNGVDVSTTPNEADSWYAHVGRKAKKEILVEEPKGCTFGVAWNEQNLLGR